MDNILKKFPIIKTKRLLLNELRENDIKDLYLIYSNKKVMKYMQAAAIKNLKDAENIYKSYKKMYRNKNGFRWGVRLQTNPNKLIGTFALHYYSKKNKRVEMGADLKPEYWNKGYSSEIVKKMINFAFEKLNIERLELRCLPENYPSKKIAEKFGFKYEGTLRNYVFVEGKGFLDESVYSLLKEEIFFDGFFN